MNKSLGYCAVGFVAVAMLFWTLGYFSRAEPNRLSQALNISKLHLSKEEKITAQQYTKRLRGLVSEVPPPIEAIQRKLDIAVSTEAIFKEGYNSHIDSLLVIQLNNPDQEKILLAKNTLVSAIMFCYDSKERRDVNHGYLLGLLGLTSFPKSSQEAVNGIYELIDQFSDLTGL